MGRLFGTDGVRGIANEELTCELAMLIGRAVSVILTDKNGKPPSVMIGCDTRESSDMLASSIMAGLCSMGANAVMLGVTSTPAVAYLTSKKNMDAGIMISASHNPSEYNGIKIFSSDGFKLPDALEDLIETIILMPDKYINVSSSKVGRVIYALDMLSDYKKYLISSATAGLKGLRIALDCANGSASQTAPEVMKNLGAEITLIGAEPDGKNINRGCGSTSMEALKKTVTENKLDAGFAFDGDADRCLCIDENGEEVDGDFILAMCALDMKQTGRLKNNTVVGTIMSNYGFTEFCKANGINFIPTKVGDRYVLEEMLLGDYKIGGEQSGHIIFRDYATTGDGQLTAIQILSLMKRSGKSLSQLKSVMKKSPQVLINIPLSGEAKLRFYTDSEIQKAIKDEEFNLTGVGRVVVRPSGTEPLVRVMTEGSDEQKITESAEKIASVIRKNLL